MSTIRPATGRKIRIAILAVLVAIFMYAGARFLDSVYVPVIIMYHSVGSPESTLDGYGSKLNVSPAAFEKQMKFLHDKNYKVIPLELFVKKIKNNEKIPRKTLAITFDDGLKNNFTNAYPVLKKYNFPATIFVATDFVGRKKFLSWQDIRIMQEDNISIGSHTRSHRWLPAFDPKALKEELAVSREVLEKRTGKKITLLSYPLGGFDDKTKKIAEEIGYIGAVATNPGMSHPADDPYALKRIRISMTSDNLLAFWIEISGYYTLIKEIRDEE